MKKVLLAIVSFTVLIGMVACSNDDNNKPNNDQQNEVNDQNVNTNENQSSEDIGENSDNDQINENSDNAEENQASGNDGVSEENQDNQDSLIPEELADFEETPTLSEQIDLNTLSPKIETDNQNNRVIIYSDDSNNKQYKSIFIKKQNRLKIISLDDDGQIFNEIIE